MTLRMATAGPTTDLRTRYKHGGGVSGAAAAAARDPRLGRHVAPCPITGNAFIRAYPDTLGRDGCERLLALYDREARAQRQGLTGGANGAGMYNPAFKRCRELSIGPETYPEAVQMLGPSLLKSFGRYAEDVPSFSMLQESNPLRDTGYLLQVYQPGKIPFAKGGDGFGWHCDAFNPVSNARVLAVILYLNDVAEGGETQFSAWRADGLPRTTADEEMLAVRPEAGTAIWFPPGFEFEHRGCTPRSSRKAIITSFIVYR